MTRSSNPLQQYLDTSCAALANGSIQWYENNTTTPKEVWQDTGFTISQANPTPLDACGQVPELLFLDGTYTAVVMDSTTAVINTFNDVTGIGGGASGGSSSDDITYLAPFTGSVEQTVTNRLGQRIYISDFAIVPQVTDQRLEIQTVIDNLSAIGEFTLVFNEPGSYLIAATETDVSAGALPIGLILKPNVNIEIRPGATIGILTNSQDSNALFLATPETNNVTIFGGGTIAGDRESHTAGTGELGDLIYCAGVTGLTVKDVLLRDAWGRGIYVTESQDTNAVSIGLLLQHRFP